MVNTGRVELNIDPSAWEVRRELKVRKHAHLGEFIEHFAVHKVCFNFSKTHQVSSAGWHYSRPSVVSGQQGNQSPVSAVLFNP